MLKDKKIVVVGAGGLLGRHLVNVLLNQGAIVLAADINSESLQEQLMNQKTIDVTCPRLSLVHLDVTNERDVVDFFETADNLDGAVNCSYPRNKRYGAHFYNVNLSDFNENVSLLLGSAFLFAQQCASYFVRNQTPFSLVNIASIYGVVSPKFDIYANTSMTTPVEYAAVKAALIHLTKYIASYVSNSNFRINTVSPGGINDHQSDLFLKAYKEQTLGKGMLDPDDITGTIVFLLSSYSRYMNGQNLVVDDGFSV